MAENESQSLPPAANELREEGTPDIAEHVQPAGAEPAPAPANGEAAADNLDEFLPTIDVPLTPEGGTPTTEIAPTPVPPAQQRACAQCQAPRREGQLFCVDCGWVFPTEEDTPSTEMPGKPAAPVSVLWDRYEIGPLIAEHGMLARYRGLDRGDGSAQPCPVVILRAIKPAPVETAHGAEVAELVPADEVIEAEIIPAVAEPPAQPPAAEAVPEGEPDWPGIAWEQALLERIASPLLPRVLNRFSDGGYDYLVEEVPAGRALWDAWDDPDSTNEQRYGWLRQIAGTLRQLHQAGAILESFRPELFVLSAEGQPRVTSLAELLPLPLPPNPPLHGSLYAAPELVLSGDKADARANLYSFGAMLYSLLVGRELTEMDFDRHGSPRELLPSFPDIHPALGRLITKTFCRDVAGRFPSDEAQKEDASGFTELMRTLAVCGQMLDSVRLDIAAWTTTGMVRTGNEDAFALLHTVEARQEELDESALILLADGMGGSEAGEVAAALAVQTLRSELLRREMFASLGAETLGRHAPFKLETCRAAIGAALAEANRQVLDAARAGLGRRGMGCTAEVLYIRGHHFVVGHVGDSRTYHFHEGGITQLTRDQTLVNRLVELGTITAEQAESHPRRSELQQAIGGRADVEPALHDGTLTPGDWLLVCSDGLTNHIRAEELGQMLQREASCAETAARRLVNFANLRGATDNTTVVVIRAT